MSSDLMHMIQEQLSNKNLIEQLSQQIGGASHQQTAAATSGIVSILTGALAKNASTTEGASSLANALDRDHDGSILDDVMGMLTGAKQPDNTNMLNGSGILSHLLGDRQSGATDMVSKISGLDSGKVGSLMTMIAPLVMGMLGKAKRQNGLDVAGIASLLSGTFNQQRAQASQNPAVGMISSFLDQDGDGDIKDDIAKIGMNLLGNLFKRK